jgi:hypothetical protein
MAHSYQAVTPFGRVHSKLVASDPMTSDMLGGLQVN